MRAEIAAVTEAVRAKLRELAEDRPAMGVTNDSARVRDFLFTPRNW
jgi:hypothetical protein